MPIASHPCLANRGFLWLPRRPHATHGYEPTREAAMAAFAKSWKR
jgi:hypothetical protein